MKMLDWIGTAIITIILLYIFSPLPSKSLPSSSEDEGLQESSLQTPVFIDMIVTAYCPCQKCCYPHADGTTASGRAAIGKLIAAPSKYPFGTVMDVPGYGVATVQDRGGAIKGNKIDLLFPTHQGALDWGNQELKVKVFK